MGRFLISSLFKKSFIISPVLKYMVSQGLCNFFQNKPTSFSRTIIKYENILMREKGMNGFGQLKLSVLYRGEEMRGIIAGQ